MIKCSDRRCILFCSYIKPQLRICLNQMQQSCILFCSYIKPQLTCYVTITWPGCILFCSYIKPQLACSMLTTWRGCILFCSYIKPQPYTTSNPMTYGCILFCSYIKPQQGRATHNNFVVVSYSVPISNHNLCCLISLLISGLHWILGIGSGEICHLIRCKSTKKVLIAMGFDVFSASFPFRNSSRCRHIACL